jgi:hypothetical protein
MDKRRKVRRPKAKFWETAFYFQGLRRKSRNNSSKSSNKNVNTTNHNKGLYKETKIRKRTDVKNTLVTLDRTNVKLDHNRWVSTTTRRDRSNGS